MKWKIPNVVMAPLLVLAGLGIVALFFGVLIGYMNVLDYYFSDINAMLIFMISLVFLGGSIIVYSCMED